MRLFFLILLLALPASLLVAAEDISSKSPTDKFKILFTRGTDREDYTVKAISADNQVLFQAPVDLSVYPNSIIWHKSGDRVAFSAGTHFLMESYVLSHSPDGFILSKLPPPEHAWDNFHVIPTKWKGDNLSVAVDGPYAGHADNGHYSGRMLIFVPPDPRKAKVLSEQIDQDKEK
jgi:hypothetical protein